MSKTFEDYWERLVEMNPSLGKGDVKISITTAEFKKQVKKAFEEGRDLDIAKDSFCDLFGGMFGK